MGVQVLERRIEVIVKMQKKNLRGGGGVRSGEGSGRGGFRMVVYKEFK